MAPEWKNVVFETMILARRDVVTGYWFCHWGDSSEMKIWPPVILGNDQTRLRSRYDGIKRLFAEKEAK